MNLNIIFSILQRLVSDYETEEIAESLTELSAQMDEIASNPRGSDDEQLEYDSLHTDLFIKLRNFDANNLTSFEIEYLKATPFDTLLPGKLKSRVLAAERGKNLTPASAAARYKNFKEDFDNEFQSAKSLVDSLSEIGAESYVEPGEAFLALIMTSDSFDNDLKEFHLDLKSFEQGLTFIIDGSNFETEKPKIHALSNITPITVVSVSIAVVLAVAKVIEKALDIAIKAREYQKLGLEIKISDNELANKLEEHTERMRKAEIESVVEELAANDRGDTKNKVRKGVSNIFALIEKGHTIDFVVSEPDELEEGDVPDGEVLSLEQFKNIRKISFELKKIQKDDVAQLLLEAPQAADLPPIRDEEE